MRRVGRWAAAVPALLACGGLAMGGFGAAPCIAQGLPPDMCEGQLAPTVAEADTVEIGRITTFRPLQPVPVVKGEDVLVRVTFSYDTCAVLKGTDAVRHHDYSLALNPVYLVRRHLLVPGSYALCAWRMRGSDSTPTIESLTYPILPLGPTKPDLAAIMKSSNLTTRVTRTVAGAMADPNLHVLLSYALACENSQDVPAMVYPFLKDPNPEVRMNALLAMVFCQQVSVIPLLAEQVRADNRAGKATDELGDALGSYRARAAVPDLCRLLFQPELSLRKGAMTALFYIGVPESIPYLLLALRDPDPAAGPYSIRGDAFVDLRCWMPELDPVYLGNFDLGNNPVRQTAPMVAWWQDELNGKHTGPSRVLVAPGASDMPLPRSTDDLGHLLFQTNVALRRRACTALAARSYSQDNLPYLMIALEDPDDQVAYRAYRYLVNQAAMAAGGMSAAGSQSEAKFASDRDSATKPIYLWWSSRLQRTSPPPNDGYFATTR